MSLKFEQPHGDVSDEQLLERYRGGDTEAFAVLVERYRHELFNFLNRFTGNRSTAEDVFQDTFLQVHLSADTFDTTRNFKPWLFTIAANKARDVLRKNMRRQTTALSAPLDASDAGGRSYIDLLEADLPLPSEVFGQQETQELVKQVVAQMPDHLRQVLVLAYFHQFAYKEIAEILSVPLGTVKSRLHSAVGTFAQRWKEKYESAEPPPEAESEKDSSSHG